jgi:hypothetical protein
MIKYSSVWTRYKKENKMSELISFHQFISTHDRRPVNKTKANKAQRQEKTVNKFK